MATEPDHYIATFETDARPYPWRWELRRRSSPMGVIVGRTGYQTRASAEFAGKEALERFLIGLAKAIDLMISKPLDLPMQVAKQFVKDMRAFHAEPNAIKRDETAARQLHVLRKFQGPRAKKLRIIDIEEMFRQMKDHA